MKLYLFLPICVLATGSFAQFLEAPNNITVLIGDGGLVTFNCRVPSSDDFVWTIDGESYNTFNRAEFSRRNIEAVPNNTNGVRAERLLVGVSRRNNGTKVVCEAFGEEELYCSEPAYLTIVDVPLPPGIHWTTVDANTLEVTWGEPFTRTQYPITSYFISIETTNSTLPSGDIVQVNTTLSSSTFLYNITSDEVPVCTILAITMTASSDVGTSEPATIFTALPDSPGEFLENPSIEVEFNDSQVSRIYIQFRFPFLCSYSDAMYTITIRDQNGRLQHRAGPHIQSWRDGGEEVNSMIEDPDIVSNAKFTLVITVTTIAGRTDIQRKFTTFDIYDLNITTNVSEVNYEVFFATGSTALGVLIQLLSQSKGKTNFHSSVNFVQSKSDAQTTNRLPRVSAGTYSVLVFDVEENGQITSSLPAVNKTIIVTELSKGAQNISQFGNGINCTSSVSDDYTEVEVSCDFEEFKYDGFSVYLQNTETLDINVSSSKDSGSSLTVQVSTSEEYYIFVYPIFKPGSIIPNSRMGPVHDSIYNSSMNIRGTSMNKMVTTSSGANFFSTHVTLSCVSIMCAIYLLFCIHN